MYPEDVSLLCCPVTREPLALAAVTQRDSDGEVLEGELESVESGHKYLIKNGIPRFLLVDNYNETWDYKWKSIDRGKGLNYRIADKTDPAYAMHDIYDRNNHDGKAFEHAKGNVVLDIGCGVGQYSWRTAKEYLPKKIVSFDLTTGVDVFRQIMLERFPEYKSMILMVQGSVLQMPFPHETFDYVFSLGVLMHTGNTREAIRQAARVVKPEGELNFWVYAAAPVHIDVKEPGRKVPHTLVTFIPYQAYYIWVMFQVNLFRRLPHAWCVRVIRWFSSDFWYAFSKIPILRVVARIIFPSVMHPDRDYRYINNYDGWCNTWADTWTEQELFGILREESIAILGISDWRTGFWGRKLKGFYP